MGMDAEVVAIGKVEVFRYIDCALDYPAKQYKAEGVKDGDDVIVTLAQCQTTAESLSLAKMLGVEPWALGQHRVLARVVGECRLRTDGLALSIRPHRPLIDAPGHPVVVIACTAEGRPQFVE